MTSPAALSRRVGLDALADYPDRLDVRSPAEFADDHIPGASNYPVLDDEQRARVGTLYAQSPFAAKKMGAALVARNIASMIETAFAEHSREWRPLVYCWRGGQRSRALVHILNEVGWRAAQLDGGYRAYRRHVVATLAVLPARYRFVVICGLTGSGKSKLLAALARAGAQTLDLEGVAQHRGSLLGDIPGAPQPSQKGFESRLVDALALLDPRRVVFVESESKRIGALQVPDALLEGMRAGSALMLKTPLAQRVGLLMDEYRYFFEVPDALVDRLHRLIELHGKATIARWEAMAVAGHWSELVSELLSRHYDPTYTRSLGRNFPAIQHALTVTPRDVSTAGFAALARELLSHIESAELAV